MYSQWQVTMNDEIVLFKQLDELKDQHRQLDEGRAAVVALAEAVAKVRVFTGMNHPTVMT